MSSESAPAKERTQRNKTVSNGEGSVYRYAHKGSWRWRAAKTVAVVDGVPRRITGSGVTRTQALERLAKAELKYRRLLGEEIPDELIQETAPKADADRTTFEEVAEQWFTWKTSTTIRHHRVKESTAYSYRRLLDNHIIPAVGKHPIRLITTEQLHDFLHVKLLAKKKMRKNADGLLVKTDEQLVSLSHQRAAQGIVSMIFAYAKKNKFVPVDPSSELERVEKPDNKRKGIDDARREELLRFVDFIHGTEHEARWVMSLYALRKSERLGLTWDCFRNLDDPKKATVEIKQQLSSRKLKGKGLYIEPTVKSDESARIIPLDDRVRRVLLGHKAKQEGWMKEPEWQQPAEFKGLVYTHKNGKPIHHNTDTADWAKVWAAAGNEPLAHHSIRHLAISILVSEEVPIEFVRSIAGHHSVEITRAVYTHLSARDKQIPIRTLTTKLFEHVEKRERGQERAQADLAAIKKAKKKKTPEA